VNQYHVDVTVVASVAVFTAAPLIELGDATGAVLFGKLVIALHDQPVVVVGGVVGGVVGIGSPPHQGVVVSGSCGAGSDPFFVSQINPNQNHLVINFG